MQTTEKPIAQMICRRLNRRIMSRGKNPIDKNTNSVSSDKRKRNLDCRTAT